MNVLFVAQCSGKALTETRRILDQFAERCGDRVWQTPITREGHDVVHALLRKSVRKNTVVVCCWIHGRDHSEILWIVVDRSRFNPSDAVPTGASLRVSVPEENDWRTGEGRLLLVAMAALWHDLGKCSCVFQETLRGSPMDLVLGMYPARKEATRLNPVPLNDGAGAIIPLCPTGILIFRTPPDRKCRILNRGRGWN